LVVEVERNPYWRERWLRDRRSKKRPYSSLLLTALKMK
jgi:hypothetical protein